MYSPASMHIPDGFLSLAVALVGWALAVAAIAFALRQTRQQLGPKQIPLMGVLAAFIFAAQAINFPVAGGTSGHLLGGALAAVILGPWAAVLVMTSVIAVQALVFQDGGLLALGFNIVNMGILTAFAGHLVYSLTRLIGGEGRKSLLTAGALGAWLSVMAGAAATAVELTVSGTTPLRVALPAMLGVHALIGLGEAAITVGALAFLIASRRDLLNVGQQAPARTTANLVVIGLGLALAVAALSPLASGDPDGLYRVAADLGFDARALSPVFEVFAGYTIPVVGDEALSKITAVAVGTLIVFGLVLLIGRWQRRAAA
jgi:cobalt/nickel transport system permease protein